MFTKFIYNSNSKYCKLKLFKINQLLIIVVDLYFFFCRNAYPIIISAFIEPIFFKHFALIFIF